MNSTEAKQRAIDALLAKLRDAFDLELVEGPHLVGPSEYVAVRRETGEVRFLGQLGE